MQKRKTLITVWIVFLLCCLALFIFNPNIGNDLFTYLSSKSLAYLYVLLLVFGVLRSFTFIPVTYLIILGLLFVPAVPLYFIIVFGIMVSSSLVYYFFEYLHIDKMLENKYHKQLATTKYYMTKYELPVIIVWSMSPMLPSDVICYVAGTLRVNFYKFLLGMFVGEGLACAVYIFGGKYLLNYFFGINF
jgi:uncharacterized membrane protein YdjX (TVP38/TMEM64 family)